MIWRQSSPCGALDGRSRRNLAIFFLGSHDMDREDSAGPGVAPTKTATLSESHAKFSLLSQARPYARRWIRLNIVGVSKE
jgi:hypothetical protein